MAERGRRMAWILLTRGMLLILLRRAAGGGAVAALPPAAGAGTRSPGLLWRPAALSPAAGAGLLLRRAALISAAGGRYLRRAAVGVAVAALAGWPSPAADAEAAPAPRPAVTMRADLGGRGMVLRTRLLQRAEWGRAVAVMTAGDAADSPLDVVLGLEAPGALAGPVALTGAWRELAAPLGHNAGSTVFAEATRLRLKSGLYPGALRGVQLTPAPGLTVMGFRRPAAAGARAGPPAMGFAAALPPLAALRLETYAALRTAAPPQSLAGWKLGAPPFPGGLLALAGVRAALPVAGVDLWASANLSGGPRVPVDGYARLAARGGLEFGELRALVAVAGREFRGLSGTAAPAPLAWALQFRGAPGPREWTFKYRLEARGEELAPVLRPFAADSPARKLSVSVTPVLHLGLWNLSATGKLDAAARGITPSAGARWYGRPGELAVTWRAGAGAGAGSLRVRGAVNAAPVTASAGVSTAGGAATADLGIRLRTPEFSVQADVRKLGKAPPAGPAVTVTFTSN